MPVPVFSPVSFVPENREEITVKAPFGWAGGKTKQIGVIRDFFPPVFQGRYIEPFLGAGTVLLDRLQAWDGMNVTYIAADLNDALINFWICLKDEPEEIIKILSTKKEFQHFNNKNDNARRNAFNDLRNEFNRIQKKRESSQPFVTDLIRTPNTYFAAVFFYLIKTSFRSIWRIGKNGQLTSGVGYPLRQLFDPVQLRKLSGVLQRNNVQFLLMDFSKTIQFARKGDIVYCDPPYYTESMDISNGYVAREEDYDDIRFQEKVWEACTKLADKGVFMFVSNADAPLIRQLFEKWWQKEITVLSRMTNTTSKTNNELLLFNQLIKSAPAFRNQFRAVFQFDISPIKV